MSEFKGTKGEWKLVRYKTHFEIETFGTDNWLISKTITNYEQDESNVKLIACAPEMLEMLNEALKTIEWYMDNCKPENNLHSNFFNIGMNQREQIENLIKKATE